MVSRDVKDMYTRRSCFPRSQSHAMKDSKPFPVRLKDTIQNHSLLFEARFDIRKLINLDQEVSEYEARKGFAG